MGGSGECWEVGHSPVVCTAKDCFIVGREAYIAKNYHMSRDWMKEALTKYDEGEMVTQCLCFQSSEALLFFTFQVMVQALMTWI